MKILGLKYSHDAGITLIEDGVVRFSIEMEKVDNRPRYTTMQKLAWVDEALQAEGEDINKIHHFVVDGWKNAVIYKGTEANLDVAGYHEFDNGRHDHLLDCVAKRGRLFEEPNYPMTYTSFPHMAGHIVGSYMMSPYAKHKQECAIISWDGGQQPRVHIADPRKRIISGDAFQYRATLLQFVGIIYGVMGYYWGPYKIEGEVNNSNRDKFGEYDWPGKLMSYIALGGTVAHLLDHMRKVYDTLEGLEVKTLEYHQNGIFEHTFLKLIKDYTGEDFLDSDVLATMHTFLEELLVRRAVANIPKGMPLVFTGGSALNIKWNTALRETGHFEDVWVPPNPNDSGSSMGTAACLQLLNYMRWDIEWQPYCGPKLIFNPKKRGWDMKHCDSNLLAQMLCINEQEPIIVLSERAEIGPRALGNRSILMSPRFFSNKEKLNLVKRRENFRPVAPICIEEEAPKYFDPGTPDPYMLFDHIVRDQSMISATVHIDNTARLQTVTQRQNPFIYSVLKKFQSLTGVPVLCNTSANYNGSGFFPDVRSAQEWAEDNGVKFIWANGFIFVKDGP